MSRLALIWLLASGCFYVDPINQRPSITILPASSGEVFRGTDVRLTGSGDDPQGEAIYYQWRAYLCTDATMPQTSCDAAPFYTAIGPEASFTVPSSRADVAVPVQSILVDLAGADARGATAKPSQQLVIPIGDEPPSVVLRKDSRHGYVTGTPIDLYALIGESPGNLPGGATNVGVDWVVYTPPSQPTYGLADIAVPQPDPTAVQYGKVFTPDGVGDWIIQVTATDPLQVATVADLLVPVMADHAPCLQAYEPIAPPPGQALPITAPTLFQVLVVQDDLDVYPPVPSDPILGVTSFTWSLLPPGASTRQPLAGVTGADVGIDPATYSPGDIVELRVEIQDRNHTPITCADASPTCSVISDPACIQRLTWRVEIQ